MNVLDALRHTVEAIKVWADDTKVTKIPGKGLSTNDYTTAEQNKVKNIPNDLVVIDNRLYLAQDGVVMDESAVTLPSGGGGGSSSGSITLTNNLPSTDVTAVVGGDVWLEFNYLSSEDETGEGTAYIYVENILKMTKKITPGDNKINISSCVNEGTNIVRLTCMDKYSNSRNLGYTVEMVSLRLSSGFDATVPYSGDIHYTYTPTIRANKTVHFILDGSEIGTANVTESGREQTYIIPKQSHGSHTLEVYFTVNIDGENDIPSNHLYYDLICTTSGVTTPIIACPYNNNEVGQYDTLIIPYIVYSPTSQTSNIVLSANGETIDSLTVSRTEQKWSYRADKHGSLRLTISCSGVSKNIDINVIKSDIDVEATTNNLELYLSSYGRSNNATNPATWTYGDISAEFSNFNFTSDGWQLDDDGVTVLRISGDARLEIPINIFANDFRTTGKTIEIEFASREVLDYDAVIMSCMSGGRGIQITSQRAELFSEQSTIGTQYKENEHIRISFVVEKKNENRFLLIYLNGILSGAEVYPSEDDFTQVPPAGISIGSNYCTTDIYCIRVYNNSLTRHQILDNWIADTQNGPLLIDRYSRNQVYNDYGDVTINRLPKDLPYLVIEAAALPQFKKDKKPCSGYYVDLMNPDRSFSFENAEIDVQGTSSQYYYVKNYKIKFNGGFRNNNGVISDNYQLNSNVIATNEFTFKADVASSEGANNVVLAQVYNNLCPTLTPLQQEDSRVRQTIDGHPIVVFYNDGTSIKFLGKYNFNNDKGTAEVFGFADGDESWEIRQNGTDRVSWKSDDFSSGSGWENDFEARYPEDNTNTTKLKALATWLVSTNIEAATNNSLTSPVTYNGVRYTTDSVEYRLAKFRVELPDHADVNAMIFYYLFTEIFLCIDQREKNAFPTLFEDMGKWIMFFYDADSSLGIDNKGKLAFSPFLEDIDYTLGGDPVYNGQGSVLWVNLRKTYYDEIASMYQQLRIDNKISYDIVDYFFEKHQGKWCEAIFNEDMYRKCLEPMIVDADSQYLPMLLGKKELHRKWWLYNRFRFLDSKYVTGNSMETRIMIRSKSKANVSLTPYVNMYGHVYYNDEMVEHRMERNKEYEFVWAASGAEDAVIGINDADMLISLGDLAPLQVETIDISLATHLTSLKIGDASTSYSNKNLTSVTFGNNGLLRSIDLRNCSSLNTALNVSGCTNIEEIYCDGTSITGVELPNGGILKTLHLPATVTNLTVCNQPSLSDFKIASSSNITTLRLENVGALIDTPSVINAMADGGRIRVMGIDWEVASESALTTLFNKLVKMRGLDENSNNMDTAIVTGRIRVKTRVSDEIVGKFYDKFPDIVIDDGSGTPYIINFLDRNGNSLYVVRVAEGANVVDPIEVGILDRPADIVENDLTYEFVGWSYLPTNVMQHHKITPVYKIKYTVNYYSGSDIVYQYGAYEGDSAMDPVATGKIPAPTKAGTSDVSYKFSGWDSLPTDIQSSVNIYATYDTYFAARFWNDNKIHVTEWVRSGGNVVEPDKYFDDYVDPTRTSTAKYDFTFSKWASSWNESHAGLTVDEFNKLVEAGSAYITEVNYENITSARDYVVVYTPILRKYNVEFYNGTTLLETDYNIQYGSSTSYNGPTPVRTGVDNPDEYVFKGWMPSPENITGETKCYALFKYTGYLFGKLGKTDSEDYGYGTVDNPNWTKINSYWTQISADASSYKSGVISEDYFRKKYQIGGRMIIPINLPDGTSTVADVEIIGYDHDNLADGSGKAPLTFFCKDLPDIMKRIGDNNYKGGWNNTEVRGFINGDLYNVLPSNLQTAIKPVLKISDGGISSKTLITTEDKCWLASASEVGMVYSDVLSGQGEVYSLIFSSANSSRVKYIVDTTIPIGWWTRSASYGGTSSTQFCRVMEGGGKYGDNPWVLAHIAFGFCI